MIPPNTTGYRFDPTHGLDGLAEGNSTSIGDRGDPAAAEPATSPDSAGEGEPDSVLDYWLAQGLSARPHTVDVPPPPDSAPAQDAQAPTPEAAIDGIAAATTEKPPAGGAPSESPISGATNPATPTASQEELSAIDRKLADPLSRELVAAYGGSTSVPDSEVGRAAIQLYGAERAAKMLQLGQAIEAMRQEYLHAADFSAANPPPILTPGPDGSLPIDTAALRASHPGWTMMIEGSGDTGFWAKPVFNADVFTAVYAAQDTLAGHAFSALYGISRTAAITPGDTYVTPGPTASQKELSAVDLVLTDSINQDIVATYGGSTTVPDNAVGNAAVKHYGPERASQIQQLAQAITSVRQDYWDAVKSAADHPPFQSNVLNPDGSVNAAKLANHPGWSAGVSSEDGVARFSSHFELADFTAIYAKQDTPASRAFAALYGDQITDVANPYNYPDASGSVPKTLASIGGSLFQAVGAGWVNGGGGEHEGAPVWQTGQLAATGPLALVDLDHPPELHNSSYVWFDPSMGYVTDRANVIVPHGWEDQALTAMFVFGSIYVMGGAATDFGSGVANVVSSAECTATSLLAGEAATASFTGLVSATANGIVNDDLSFRSLLTGALGGIVTSLVGNVTSINTMGLNAAGEIVNFGERLMGITGQATLKGALAELAGGNFSDGLREGFIDGLAHDITQQMSSMINTKETSGALGTQQASALRILTRATGSAIRALGNPNDRNFVAASGFIKEWIANPPGLENQATETRQPSATVIIDEDGNLMPGVIDTTLPESEQVAQLEKLLIKQGMDPEDAEALAFETIAQNTAQEIVQQHSGVDSPSARRIDTALEALASAAEKYGGLDNIPNDAPELQLAIESGLANSEAIRALAGSGEFGLGFGEPILLASLGESWKEAIGAQLKQDARDLTIIAGSVAGILQTVGDSLIGAGQLAKDLLLAQQYILGGGDNVANRLLPGFAMKQQAYQNVRALGDAIAEIGREPARYLGEAVGKSVEKVSTTLSRAQGTDDLSDWFLYGNAMGNVTAGVVSVIAGAAGAARLATAGAGELNALLRVRINALAPEVRVGPFPPELSTGSPIGTGAKGFISGDAGEIARKMAAAESGDLSALGEINAAKALQAEGVNVHFRTAAGDLGIQNVRTSDFFVGGTAQTGEGGLAFDVFSPTTGNTGRVASQVAKKLSQTDRVIINLDNSTITPTELSNIIQRVNNIPNISKPLQEVILVQNGKVVAHHFNK